MANVARSFGDVATKTVNADIPMVVAGFAIVFNYVIIMLGDFHCVTNRVITSN